MVLGINLWQSQSIVLQYQNMYPEILMLKDSGNVWNTWKIGGYIPLNYLINHDMDMTVDYRMEGFSQSTFSTRIQNALSDVSVELTPASYTYQQNGSLVYDITLHNWVAGVRNFYILLEADTPNGQTVRLAPPKSLTLNPSQILTIPMTHAIPGSAPLGVYTYRAQIGLPPNVLWFRETFEFEIVP